MKKIILLLSVLVIAMFLVGCVQESEKIDVIDEEGNLVGEALRIPSKKVSGAKSAEYSMQLNKKNFDLPCQNQIDSCGFVTEKSLPEKINMICFNHQYGAGLAAGFKKFDFTKTTPTEFCELQYKDEAHPDGGFLVLAQKYIYEIEANQHKFKDIQPINYNKDMIFNVNGGLEEYSLTCCVWE
jgi:hypothetical protein